MKFHTGSSIATGASEVAPLVPKCLSETWRSQCRVRFSLYLPSLDLGQPNSDPVLIRAKYPLPFRFARSLPYHSAARLEGRGLSVYSIATGLR